MFKARISKKNRSLIIGIACGLLCALSVGMYVTEVDKQAEAAQMETLAKYGGEQIEVCVAKNDIVAGETISESDIETRTWIATLLPANAVSDRKDAVGKQVGSTILAGEVISSNRFGFDSVALEIPDGFVAVSVPSHDVQSVGGAIKTGSIVDIYAIGASSTTRIASSVQVLATSLDSESGTSSGASAWITVAVKPAKVQELVSAAQNLELYFTLPSESAKTTSDESLEKGLLAERTGAATAEETRPAAPVPDLQQNAGASAEHSTSEAIPEADSSDTVASAEEGAM